MGPQTDAPERVRLRTATAALDEIETELEDLCGPAAVQRVRDLCVRMDEVEGEYAAALAAVRRLP